MAEQNHETEDEKTARRRQKWLVVIALVVGVAMLVLSFYAGKYVRQKFDSAPLVKIEGSAHPCG